MKIVYIDNARLPTEKAHGRQIMKTCESLATHGHRVDLIVPDRANPMKDQDPFKVYHVKSIFSLHQLPVLDVMPWMPEVLEPVAYAVERKTFFYSLRRVMPFLSDADVFFVRDATCADALIRYGVRQPIFFEVHDDPRTDSQRWRRVRAGMRGYVAISRGVQELLLHEGIPETSIMIAPDGFDPSDFEYVPDRASVRRLLHIDPSVFLLVYAGHLFPWKGVDTIAPFFDRLPIGCQLVIVGGNPEDIARVKRLMPTESPHVLFAGHVPYASVLQWLSAADAALLPTSGRFEIGKKYTSPLKLFEYLAAGLPVLASDVPSSREILDENIAVFFTPDNGIDFIRAAERIVHMSDDQKKQMSQRARGRAEMFTWGSRGEKIEAFITSRHS